MRNFLVFKCWHATEVNNFFFWFLSPIECLQKNWRRREIEPSTIKTANITIFTVKFYKPWRKYFSGALKPARCLLLEWLRNWFAGLWCQVRVTPKPFGRQVGVRNPRNPEQKKGENFMINSIVIKSLYQGFKHMQQKLTMMNEPASWWMNDVSRWIWFWYWTAILGWV